jgi:hypothetical protein
MAHGSGTVAAAAAAAAAATAGCPSLVINVPLPLPFPAPDKSHADTQKCHMWISSRCWEGGGAQWRRRQQRRSLSQRNPPCHPTIVVHLHLLCLHSVRHVLCVWLRREGLARQTCNSCRGDGRRHGGLWWRRHWGRAEHG